MVKNKNKIQEFKEVEGFLDSLKMIKYFEKFIENGIEDLETILELEDSHFQIMGIPLGHKLKILKRIKEIKKEEPKVVSKIKPMESKPLTKSTEKRDTSNEEKIKMFEDQEHLEFLKAREEFLKGGETKKNVVKV